MSLQLDPPSSDDPSTPALRLHLVEDPPATPGLTPVATSPTTSARTYRSGLRITDTAAIAIPVALACLERLSALGLTPTEWAHAAAVPYWSDAIIVIAAWAAMLWLVGARDARMLGAGPAEYSRVAIASAMTFSTVAIGHILAGVQLERWLFVLAFPLGFLTLLLGRGLWRVWLKRQGLCGRALARVIVVGPRADVDDILHHADLSPCGSYAVVGAVIEPEDGVPDICLVDGLPTITGFDRISAFTQVLSADAVLVAGTSGTRNTFIRDLAWRLERTGTDLLVMSVPANVGSPRLRLRSMGGLPLIRVEIPQFSGRKHALKRAFDIVASVAALILLLPLLIALVIIIRADSPGPAIFRQERVGRDGHRFQMLKFRSMRVTAAEDLESLLDRNEGAGLLFKMRSDPRITRVGRTIRRRSLDELPQLWNILVGDMSLVGPRPPLPREVDSYEGHEQRRLYIRPGLTGIWQVSGRSTLSWDRSVELDLYYVENWSLAGDIAIILRTVHQVTNPVGAF